MLTLNEWELAARYRGSDTTNVVTGKIAGVNFDAMEVKWTKGNSASGATADSNDSTATGKVAVYNLNSDSKTAEVKSKRISGVNVLGLYDMSGNVSEWNFDWRPSDIGICRVERGGSCRFSADSLPIGVYFGRHPQNKDDYIGFRFARSH